MSDDDCFKHSCEQDPTCPDSVGGKAIPGQCVLPVTGQCTVPATKTTPASGSGPPCNVGLCWSPLPLTHPEQLTNVYSLATNNYIAEGGSGFKVLQRNTTQLNTNILQRDALIDYMREGQPCGYTTKDNGLHPCATDADCQDTTGTDPGPGSGFVCECPGNPLLSVVDGTPSCLSQPTPECVPGTTGLCVRQDCRNDVAQYLLTSCMQPNGSNVPDYSACVKTINPCSVGGEECKYLSCVDATESALVDGRITVIQ
jgi:5'-nucleotidase/UDP-sugar diphosphatase